MKHTVLPMLTEDYDEVLTLWKNTPGIGPTLPEPRVAFEAYLHRNPGLSLVVRNDADQIIGAVLCGHDGARGTIRHLVVSESYRNQGIGRDLVRRCLAGLKAEGIQKCTIFVKADNSRGEAFWIRDGWQPRDDLKAMSKML